MSDAILIRGARQLLTLRGPSGPRCGPALRDLGLIQDGALLIQDGLIQEVGPTRRVENLAAARHARSIDATGRVVMPGFVDSHTHLVYGPVGAVSARRLELRARAVIEGMARHGTTTLEAKSGYGRDATGEIKILRVLALLDGHPLDVEPTFLVSRDGVGGWPVRACADLMPRIRRRKLARFADIRCPDAEPAARFLAAARELGFLLKVHTGATRLAVQFGAVSVDHLDNASREELEMLAHSTTIATLLPGPAFHLGRDRYPPARAFIDAGAAVGLATNFNPESSPTYSMQMVISLACAHMGMTPEEAITAATFNGAHAIRAADRVGSLEPGKIADVLLLNIPDYREIPCRFGVNQVHMTLKRGVTVYKEGSVRLCPDAKLNSARAPAVLAERGGLNPASKPSA